MMLKSAAESPCQAPVSLMATTYIVCRTDSMVRRQKMNRIEYETFSRVEMVNGARTYKFESAWMSASTQRVADLPHEVVESDDGSGDI